MLLAAQRHYATRIPPTAGRGSSGLSPQALTRRLQDCKSPEQLLQEVQRHAASLNHIHVSAAYTRAVKLCRNGVHPSQQPATVQQLLSQLHQLATQLQQQCGARELANIIWACGRLRDGDTFTVLLPVFLQASKLQQADPQNVSNVLLAAEAVQLQPTDQQLQLLLQQVLKVLPQAKPQEASNTVWAVASIHRQIPAQQLEPVLQHFMKVLPKANPQDVSNILWAVASMQQYVPKQHVPEHQLQQMEQRSVELLAQAKPQDESNTMWAFGKLQYAPQELLSALERFLELLPITNPQDVSNTLWAVATMQQQLPSQQLQQFRLQQLQQVLQHFVEVLAQARPQAISNTLWACGKLQYRPQQLLSALEQHPEQLQALMAAAIPQDLANMAWACGQMGYKGRLLPEVLLQQAVTLQAGKTGCLNLQNICNLCWAAAVLDLQQCVPQVLQLAASTGCLPKITMAEDLRQLYQVHLWLLDSQPPTPGQGLSGVLSPQRLQQCKEEWEQQVAVTVQQKVTDLQQSVSAEVQRLPAGTWQQQPQLEQRSKDRAFSIDVAATTAAGVELAIEVDGPTHFIQPGNTLEGGTLFRNRALAARGYVVVSIPYWEWEALRGAEQKQQYLLDKLQPALQLVPSKHPQKQ